MFLLPFLNHLLIKKIKQSSYRSDKVLDKNYCLVYVKASYIVCSYFSFNELNRSSFCHVNFFAISSDLLINLISKHESLSQVISISHALYLGKEIYKAELSNICSQVYTQS